MNPYKLSTDYSRLYALIMNGKEIVCFVDDGSKRILARCFITAYDYRVQTTNSILAEGNFRKIFFIRDCERMNLEFIDPTPTIAISVANILKGSRDTLRPLVDEDGYISARFYKKDVDAILALINPEDYKK